MAFVVDALCVATEAFFTLWRFYREEQLEVILFFCYATVSYGLL